MSAAGVYHIREKSETPPSESPHTPSLQRNNNNPSQIVYILEEYTRSSPREKSHLEITVCAIKKMQIVTIGLLAIVLVTSTRK